MEVLDTTIVYVSLPHIAGRPSVSNDEAAWALTSYLVSNAIVLTISGALSRRLGRRNYFLICIGMFTVVFPGLRPDRGFSRNFCCSRAFAGLLRRRPATDPAGHHPRPLSSRETTTGLLADRRRHHHRPDRRPGRRRLAHRYLQLALDLSHQHPHRHRHRSSASLQFVRRLAGDRAGEEDGATASTISGFCSSPSPSAASRSVSIEARTTTGSVANFVRIMFILSACGFVFGITYLLYVRNPMRVDLRVFKDRNFAVGSLLIA